MPLFRKRRPTVVGPDGTEYVPVDEHVAHEMAVMLSDRTVENLEREISHWVRYVLGETYGYVVCGLRGESLHEGEEVPQQPASCALTAAKAGYEARIAEFTFLEQDSSNPVVTDLIGHLVRSPEHAQSPVGAVALAASTMMNASHQAPHDPEYAQYLTPIGAGHEIHARMFAILTGCLLGQDDAGQLGEIPGIGINELGMCMRYGYYVHACQASLPDEVRAALDAPA